MLFRNKYFFLSNFSSVKININIGGQDLTFDSVESAYQAHKNYSLSKRFQQLKPLEAKKYGKAIPITTPNWNIFKVYVMATLLNIKFNDISLFTQLKSINEEIVEDNYWKDTFWGKYKGDGKNILGRMLMFIRDNNNDLNKLYSFIETELINDI